MSAGRRALPTRSVRNKSLGDARCVGRARENTEGLAEQILQAHGSRSDGFFNRQPSICGANARAAERIERVGFDCLVARRRAGTVDRGRAFAGLAVGRPIRVAEVEMVGRCPGQAEKAAMDLHMVTRTLCRAPDYA